MTPTTSLGILKPLFKSLHQNLTSFGHELPVLIYSDKCCQFSGFLEGNVDRLLDGVVKPTLNSKLEDFKHEGEVSLAESAATADDLVDDIMEHFSVSDPSRFYVGFDIEWSVNLKTNTHGFVGLIQIALDNGQVYLFQTSKCCHRLPEMGPDRKVITKGVLPFKLKVLLENDQIKKVGRQISGDFKKLDNDFDVESAGSIDIAGLARSKGVINDQRISLKNLCAQVLNLNLPKPDAIRISDWDRQLSEDHIKYAALDAVVGLKIFETLLTMLPIGEVPYDENLQVGLPVSVMATEESKIVIATGTIVSLQSPRPRSSIRYIGVQIVNVVAKSIKLKTFHGKKLLEELPNKDCVFVSVKLLRIAGTECLVSPMSGSSENIEHMEIHEHIIAQHSRNKLDPFHWFQRITSILDQNHGSFFHFCRELMFAVLEPYDEDVKEVKKYAARKGLTIDELWDNSLDFMLRRVRRRIHAPLLLEDRIRRVVSEFKDQTDASKGEKFMHEHVVERIENCIYHVKNGCLSDPPDIELYYEKGKDVNDLTQYRCVRGSNSNEGTVHRVLNDKFGAFNAGPILSYCMLLDFAARNNMKAEVRNKGGRDFGHFSPWLIDEAVKLHEELGLPNPYPEWIPTDQIAFDNNFIIGPYFEDEDDALPTGDPIDGMSKPMQFLASKMKLKIPITPVHTLEEKRLYKKLKASPLYGGLKWIQSQFNEKADGKTIFCKLMRHIEKHDKYRESAANRQATTNDLRRIQHLPTPTIKHVTNVVSNPGPRLSNANPDETAGAQQTVVDDEEVEHVSADNPSVQLQDDEPPTDRNHTQQSVESDIVENIVIYQEQLDNMSEPLDNPPAEATVSTQQPVANVRLGANEAPAPVAGYGMNSNAIMVATFQMLQALQQSTGLFNPTTIAMPAGLSTFNTVPRVPLAPLVNDPNPAPTKKARYSVSKAGTTPQCTTCGKPMKGHKRKACHDWKSCNDPACHPEQLKAQLATKANMNPN